MKIIKLNSLYLIKDVFSSSVICGFTSRGIRNLKEAILHILSFFGKDKKITTLVQLHSSNVIFTEKEGCYEGDALFTSNKKIVLVVQTADCLPLYFYNAKAGLIGILHLGWRSALRRIIDNIGKDFRNFRIIAGVGLRKCCYEVGKEFLKYNDFIPFISKRMNRLYFDPIEFVKKRAEYYGFSKNNFYDVGICSFCNGDFYSWRREKTHNRTISFIFKDG